MQEKYNINLKTTQMKRFILILICSFFANGIYSQIRFNDQWSLGISGGYIVKDGYNISLETEKILGNSPHSIETKLMFQSKGYTTDTKIPEDFTVRNYLINVNYIYTFERLLFNHIHIGLCLGAVGGYETLKSSSETVVLPASDKMVYGGSAGVKLEYSFARNISIYIKPNIMYTSSDFKNFTFSPLVGIKYYL